MNRIFCFWTNQRLRLTRRPRKIFERRYASSRTKDSAAYYGHPTICTKSRTFATACCFWRAEKFCWRVIPKLCRANTAWTPSKNCSLRWHANDAESNCSNRSASSISRHRQSRPATASLHLGRYRYGRLGIHHKISQRGERCRVRFRPGLSWSGSSLGFFLACDARGDDGFYGRRVVEELLEYFRHTAFDLGIR